VVPALALFWGDARDMKPTLDVVFWREGSERNTQRRGEGEADAGAREKARSSGALADVFENEEVVSRARVDRAAHSHFVADTTQESRNYEQ
jgi:hypothetical protein